MRMYKLKVKNNKYNVAVKSVTETEATVEVNGVEQTIQITEIKNLALPKDDVDQGPKPVVTPSKSSGVKSGPSKVAPASGIHAPIPGLIKAIFVKEGDEIAVGQKILVMEAMKMENVINAQVSGTVKKVLVGDGDNVNQGQLMVEIA